VADEVRVLDLRLDRLAVGSDLHPCVKLERRSCRQRKGVPYLLADVEAEHDGGERDEDGVVSEELADADAASEAEGKVARANGVIRHAEACER
jgi:hypothetical protein